MSSISWASAVSGDWATGSNWSGGIAPAAGDDVTIALTGAYTVHITTPVAANSLTVNNNLVTVVDTGSLTLTGALNLTAGTFNLSTGGSIVGGTIIDSGSHLSCNGGTLNGVAYQGQLNLIAGGQSVTIVNGITLSGVGGTGQANVNTNNATINFQGSQSFDNASVSLANSSINVTDPTGTGAVLTIGASTLIGSFNAATVNSINDAGGAADGIVNNGQIQVGTGSVTVAGNSFTNNGTVDIQNASSAHLVFDTSSFVNNGTISAAGGGTLQLLDASFVNDGQISIAGTSQLTIGKSGSSWNNSAGTIALSGGVLLLDGNFTTANMGPITGSGGTLKILGNLDNSGGNLSVGAASAFTGVTLGGAIKNGFINGPGGNGIVLAGGTLDGVSLAGNLDLSASGATGTIKHGITLAGVSGTGNSTILLTGSGAMLSVDGTTLLDNATITLGATLASTDQAATGAALTLGPQTAITQTGATASITSAMGAGDGIVLQGTLTVTASQGQLLNILTPTFTSTGTVNTGSFDTINLVNGQPGGTVLILNGGSFNIGNGTLIKGGTIVDAGSRLQVPGAGTLDGDVYEGVLDLTGPYDSLTIVNGITFAGAGGTGSATINFTGTGSLTFKGNETADNVLINLGTNQNGISTLASSDPFGTGATTLTLGPNATIQQVGIKAQLVSTNIGSDGIVNQGTINAGVNGGRLGLNPFNFTNQGAINASNGDNVDIGANNFTNAAAGNVSVTSGAILSIDGTGAWSNAGTISETNATLTLGGNVTTAGLGNITRSGGTVNISGNLNNTGATIAFGTSTALGTVNLTGTIKNGTVQSTANGLLGSGSATLDGVTFQGTLDLTGQSQALTIVNGITLSGAGGTGAATINLTGPGAGLSVKGNTVLDNATINYGSSQNGAAFLTASDPSQTGAILTLGPNLVIQQTGNRGVFNSTNFGSDGIINQGTINAGLSTGFLTINPYNFTNQGALNASNGDNVDISANNFTNSATGTVSVASGATLSIDGNGAWSNSGAIDETNATLNLGGNFTTSSLTGITRSGGTVNITGNLNNTGATAAFGSASAIGAVNLTGTIKNGTVQSTAGGLTGSGNGTLDGVTFQGTLDLTAQSAALTIVNGITLSGAGGTGAATINLTGPGASLSVKGNTTLDDATINYGSSQNGAAFLTASDPQQTGAILTLGPNLVIQQIGNRGVFNSTNFGTDGIINQGTINAGLSTGFLTITPRNFTNQGAINVSNGDNIDIAATNFTNAAAGNVSVTTGATLSIDGSGAWSNAGAINETNATLILGGNVTTAGLGNITRSGGTVSITGNLDNTGATIAFGTSTALGAVNLTGTIKSGTVQSTANGLLGSGNGTLDGVALQGTLDLSNQSASLTIVNGITLSGAGGTGAATINLTGPSSDLAVKGNTTLDNATINYGSSQNGAAFLTASDPQQTGAILTLGPNLVIQQTGNRGVFNSTNFGTDGIINQGTINAGLSTGFLTITPRNFTNQGAINVSNGDNVDIAATNFTNAAAGNVSVTTGATLSIDGSGAWSNAGAINETNATLILGGNVTTAGLGNITRSGGTVSITGNLDNTGATIAFGISTALGAVNLTGTVKNGTIQSTAGGLTGSGNGTLNGVTLQGTLDLSNQSASLTIVNGITLTGAGGTGAATINLTGISSLLLVKGSTTLDNATINLGAAGGTPDLFNQDGGAGNSVLTLGANLNIVQAGNFAQIAGNSTAGDGVVNDGTINASVAGGTLTISPLNFTNAGTLISGNETVDLRSTNLTNLSAGTLTGGIFKAMAGGVIQLSNNATVTTLQADVTESGAASTIQSFVTSNSTQRGIDATLTTIGTSGALRLLAGHNLTAGATFSVAGTLQLGASTFTAGTITEAATATIFGNGTVAGAVANNGLIEAKGGTLTVTGAITGSGSLQIDAGATLELGSASTDQQAVDFAGTGGTLLLDNPASYTGVIGGFDATQTLDLENMIATGAAVNGTTLTITLSGGGTQTYTLAAPLSNTAFGTFSDGNGGTLITEIKENPASATVNTSAPVNFGNHHVGDTVSQAISITNSAPTGSPSAGLDASFGAAPSGFTESGTVTMLAAGATDTTHLKLSLSTAAAGSASGSVTLNLSSDDGTNNSALPSKTIGLMGAVYAYAAPSLTGHVVNLGAARIGTGLGGSVMLSDGASANAFQESLSYSIGGPSGYALTGATSGTIASGNAVSVGVSIDGTTAGDFTGETLSLGLTSTGAGTSGLADTALAGQTVTLNGKIYAPAVVKLGSSSISFGNIHIGGTAFKTLQIGNTATGALTDTITGGIAGVTGAFSAMGNGLLPSSGVAAGANGKLSLTFSALAEGAYSGMATLSLNSHDADLSNLKLNTGPVALSGAVYAYAKPILTGKTTIDFGAARVGGTVAASTLTIADGTAADPYREALIYALGAMPTGFAAIGTTSGTVSAGSGDSFKLTLSTATAGIFANKQATLSLISTGAKTSGLADTVLGAQTLTFSGKVYAKAVAKLSTTVINFGVVHVGDTVSAKTLGVSNIATGALKDVLIGGFGTVTGVFKGSGTLGSGVAAGSSGSLTVGINTGTAGAFTGTANLALMSHDADLANVGVSVGAVTLKGVVDNYAVAGFKKIGGAGTLTKVGTNYRLNLGTITQNSTAVSVTLSAFNAAAGTADKLAGSFTIKNANGTTFSQTGFAGFAGLGAGQSTAGMKITLRTSKTGTFTETITLGGTGSNSSGYKGAVAPVTLTVTGTIAAPKPARHTIALKADDDGQAKAVQLFSQFVAAGFQSLPSGAGTVFSHVPMEGAGALLAAHH